MQFVVLIHASQGVGGMCRNKYFHIQFPQAVINQDHDINHLECLTLLIALRIWGKSEKWAHKNLLMYNQNAVQALNSGNFRDLYVQSLLRNIHWESAVANCEVRGMNNKRHEQQKIRLAVPLAFT